MKFADHPVSVQAAKALDQGQYDHAVHCYEQLVEQCPDQKEYGWLLGLAYLLQGDESAAQFTWTWAFEDADAEQQVAWTADLMQVLEMEAEHQQIAGTLDRAWLIRQYMRAVDGTNLTNQLQWLKLGLAIQQFTLEDLIQSDIILQLQAAPPNSIDPTLLLSVLTNLLDQNLYDQVIWDLIQSCLGQIEAPVLADLLLQRAQFLGYQLRNYDLACRYGEWSQQLYPDHPPSQSFLAYFYGLEGNYEQSIALAQQMLESAQTLTETLSANSLLLRSLVKTGGNWQRSIAVFQRQQQLLQNWLQTDLDPTTPPDFALFTSAFYYFPYLADQPQEHRTLQNQVAQRCQQQLTIHLNHIHGGDYRQVLFPVRRSRSDRPLRIAYMSAGFRRHSIGWLARWVMRHHDRNRFDVYIYLRQQADISDFTQQWYVDQATCTRCLKGNPIEMAQTIYHDEIDILIDLDSLTSDQACMVMALKPAPVQVTWLGLDASGMSTVDYFIADPYVLPENAQTYYAEKLWLMQNTYLAIDGFEVGVPTLRRDQLGIPSNAVVYFSSQAAFKRYPETVKLQLQILKAVPNGYFLIKGLGDETQVQQLFEQLAAEVGIAFDRLRFLPIEDLEESHRANLALADIVLDTFPYNGATTTLETLWMGIPIVTKVGQQFAARNSYGMLLNAGIHEGIAWTNQEYVDWGIRLGTDPALRQAIRSKLQQARHTAPLWDAQRFTRELEQAYEQMWQKARPNNPVGS